MTTKLYYPNSALVVEVGDILVFTKGEDGPERGWVSGIAGDTITINWDQGTRTDLPIDWVGDDVEVFDATCDELAAETLEAAYARWRAKVQA